MEKSKLQATLKTLLISYILTGILLVVLAFALYKFRLKEGQIRIGVNAVYIITCLAVSYTHLTLPTNSLV